LSRGKEGLSISKSDLRKDLEVASVHRSPVSENRPLVAPRR
jgi:hypothetical protein